MRKILKQHTYFIILTLAISLSLILMAVLALIIGDILAHILVTALIILFGTATLNYTTRQTRQKSQEQLGHQFRLLNNINSQLANAENLDELYKIAVTLGVSELGFERFALFLYNEQAQTFSGTYGIDGQGQLRDEHYFVKPATELARAYNIMLEGVPAYLWENVPLLDDNRVVGIGWNAMAFIKDNQKTIGWIVTDNFITPKQPPPPHLLDVMTQYGIFIGHHISKKRKEIQLRETEQRFYTAFHANPAGIIIVRMRDRHYVDVNPAFSQLFGYTREELLGKTSDDLNIYVDSADREFVMEQLGNYRPIRGMELKGRRKDGQIIYGRMSTELIELNGEQHYLVMSEDITEQHIARQSLQESKQELEMRVSQRTRDLQIAMDVSREISTVLDLDELLPKLVKLTSQTFNLYVVSIFIWSPQHQALTLRIASIRDQAKVLSQTGVFTNEAEFGMVLRAQKTGQIVLANDVSKSDIYSPSKNMPRTRSELTLPLKAGAHYLGILDLQSDKLNRFSPEDVRILTSLAETISIAIQNAQLYAQQVQLAEDLQNVDSMKSQFLASMSHELRTPLNAILNFTKFVARGTLGEVNPKQVDALEKVINSGHYLLSLINDVLDISKIEANKMTLFIENDVNITAELSSAIETGQNLLLERNTDVQIIADFDNTLPFVVGDKRRLRQVFLNLVSNACKFTEKGKITIRARIQGDYLVIGIIDNGPGIPLEDQERIFSAFQQSKNGIRKTEGTGLGLPISQQLVKAHHGELWLESTVGKGSAFFVKLPINAPQLLAQLNDDT